MREKATKEMFGESIFMRTSQPLKFFHLTLKVQIEITGSIVVLVYMSLDLAERLKLGDPYVVTS